MILKSLTIVLPNTHVELYREATIICTLTALPPKVELAPKLKLVHFICAGTDHVNKNPVYTDTSIPLTTSSGIGGPMISEWVILQILTHSHEQKHLLEWQREHKWGNMRELPTRRDSVGMRLGVLGYGSIGRQSRLYNLRHEYVS
jgi:phosphoglycerate dehydrogenase-like enzyme